MEIQKYSLTAPKYVASLLCFVFANHSAGVWFNFRTRPRRALIEIASLDASLDSLCHVFLFFILFLCVFVVIASGLSTRINVPADNGSFSTTIPRPRS